MIIADRKPEKATPIPDDRIALDVNDVMTIAKLSRQTVYNLINTGQLRSFKIGNRRKITREALLEFIRNAEQAA